MGMSVKYWSQVAVLPEILEHDYDPKVNIRTKN